MKKVIFNYLVIAALAVAAAFTSCGGGGSLDGTYVFADPETTLVYTFSGNKLQVEANGGEAQKATFELVEEQKEEGVSRGTIFITDQNGKHEMRYELEGDRLTFNDNVVFTKKNPTPQKASNTRSAGGGGSRGGNDMRQTAQDFIIAFYKDDYKTMMRLASERSLLDFETNGMPKNPDKWKNDLEKVEKPMSYRNFDSNRLVTTVDIHHRNHSKAMMDVILIQQGGKWFVDGIRYTFGDFTFD